MVVRVNRPWYREHKRARRSLRGLPGFLDDHQDREGGSTMRIRKSIGLVTFFVVVTAAALGFFGGNLPKLRAAQESGKSPRASLHVAERPPRILLSTVEERVDYPRYMKTQEALIRSRLVLSAALRDPKVAQSPSIKDRPDPIAWLEQDLVVTNPENSEILQVSLAAGSASGVDQAAIINAVVRAYMDQVVNADARRRAARLEQLKKLRDSYSNLLKSKRETLRKLSESVGRSERIAGLEKDAWPRLYQELRSRRIKQRIERAEIETLLERRKKTGGATDAARPGILQLEDRLAVVTAGQKVVDEELDRLAEEMHGSTIHVLDLKGMKDEIAQLEEVRRKIAAEVEALNVELEAPPRIRLLDMAVPSRP
jgi:vacuolar-type H+-ATPase subunit I/STV1